jgi:hypothetical protein
MQSEDILTINSLASKPLLLCCVLLEPCIGRK